jgi:DNA-binding NtrC family response regulator
MQARLLRVLQERVFEPLGSVKPVATNVRVLAATNQDLAQLVQAGKFREDLFYRVHVVRLPLPRLRERREDIPLLIEHFIAKFNRLQNKDVVGVADEVLARLMEHDYPGNVRELENIIEHAFVLCRGGLIQVARLPPHIRGSSSPFVSLPEASGMTLQAIEQLLIRDALRRCEGNRTAAARQLGIDPSTLHRKIKALGIDIPNPKAARKGTQHAEG